MPEPFAFKQNGDSALASSICDEFDAHAAAEEETRSTLEEARLVEVGGEFESAKARAQA
jgi:hypothetical protein